MEDFDYIDALAKSELSGREATPSNDGWDIVQEKLQRKRKKRRLFLLLLFFIIISFVGIYHGINFNSDIDGNSVTNKNTEELNTGNTQNTISDSTSTSTSISNIDTSNLSQAEKDALGANDATQNNNQQANKLQGSERGIVNAASKVKSRGSDTQNNILYNGDKKLQQHSSNTISETSSAAESEEIVATAEDVKLYAWELVPPETLKKKRKKRKKAKKEKAKPLYENTDIMVGLNGFFTPNDYQIIKSYVIELSYELKNELKNDYLLNYGVGLQFRNLHFKRDSTSFNKGELSFNLFSNVEKRFGDYSLEAGVYAGYEIYSPNNKFFSTKVKSFFDQKINYGLSAGINYKNVGLIFKYELSPYVNYLGDKKYGGFIIGLKYDF
ncbi:hypothetical protein [Kordia sp.]|uniref:hypothetical protein n=1 Tax=Kordia sp. TaxID=1965332 RepID=UPI003D275867